MKNLMLIFGLLLFSCTSNMPVEKIWKLENKKLEESILNYIDSVNVPPVKNKIVWINYKSANDSTDIYTIGYCADIFSMVDRNPLIFFRVNDNPVFLYVSGLSGFSLDTTFVIDFMKREFPEDYKYYLKNGTLPPPITFIDTLWELTFENGELIKKETIE